MAILLRFAALVGGVKGCGGVFSIRTSTASMLGVSALAACFLAVAM